VITSLNHLEFKNNNDNNNEKKGKIYKENKKIRGGTDH